MATIKRIEEIKQRKAEISKLLETEDITAEEVRKLNEEVDALISEQKELEERNNLAGKLKEPETQQTTETEEERRVKELINERRMSFSATETRNTLISTGQIAKPTEVGGINDPFNTVSSIIDQVRVDDLTGCETYEEAYITKWQEASSRTDGSSNSGTDPTFKIAQIKPFNLNITSYVSRQIQRLTPLNYADKVRQGAMIGLRKKVGEWIMSGDGSAAIYGILNAKNKESEAICAEVEVSAITETTLSDIVFEYGGDENLGANARLFLNKKTLAAFKKVRGSDKKPVYKVMPDPSNPNTGTLEEVDGMAVPYTINSSGLKDFDTATADTDFVMVYGDPSNYKLGLYGNYEIRVDESYKFAEGLLTIMGEVMVGGNVVVDKGFVIVKKVSA